MNREIKFRGKRTDNGQWVYGLLVSIFIDPSPITQDEEIEVKTAIQSNHLSYERARNYEVHPETVGQYTGLKDKEGNEIYEGDVCMFSWEKPSFTGYLQMSDSTIQLKEFAYWCWENKGFSLRRTNDNKMVSVSSKAEIQIIGNIHDNPELIK